MQKTPRMHFNRSPTCVEGARGPKIRFRDPRLENRIRLQILIKQLKLDFACPSSPRSRWGHHIYIYIYAPPLGLGLEKIRKWLVYTISWCICKLP